MNILILNASPKSKGSASAFYSSLLRLFLTRCKVKTHPLRGARDYEHFEDAYLQLSDEEADA